MDFQSQVQGTYSNGVIRPDHGLDVPEGSRVTVNVPDGGPSPETRRRAWELIDRIRREGLIKLRGGKLTRDDLYDRR
jgi:hypothetical protein